jgi:hypothetical protein
LSDFFAQPKVNPVNEDFSNSHAYRVDQALKNNPHLLNNPMLASDVAKSPDPSNMAEIIMHTAYTNAVATEVKKRQVLWNDLTHKTPEQLDIASNIVAPQHIIKIEPTPTPVVSPNKPADKTEHKSFWGSVLDTALTGLETLAKPLKEVQRDYKFVHSVYTRHGVLEGIGVGLGVVGGGVAGAFLGGPEGALLGAELAATGLRKLGGATVAKDSYADSENENYKVSMGRDVANALGAHGKTDKGQGWGSTLSGAVDLVFDVTADPIMIASKLRGVIRTGKYVKGAVVADASEEAAAKAAARVPVIYRSQSVQNYLASNSLHLSSPDALEKLKFAIDNPSPLSLISGSTARVRRGLTEIAGINSATELTTRFPTLGTISTELVKASTPDEVFNVFRRTFKEEELRNRFALGGIPLLPSRTLIGKVTSPGIAKLRQLGWSKLEESAFDKNNAANFFIPRIGQNTEGFKQFVADNTARIITESKAAVTAGTAKNVIAHSDAIDKAVELAKAQNWNQWVMPVAFNPFDSGRWATALSKKMRTFTGLQPATVNKALSEISTSTFNPTDPASFRDIYRVAYFGMGHKMATRMTDAYIESGTFDQFGRFIPGHDTHNLWLSIQSEALNAMGFPNHPATISQTLESIAAKAKGTIGGNIFGVGHDTGIQASQIATEAGTEHVALWADQAATWSYPDFRAFTKAARDMTLHGRIYGTVEGAAHKYLSQVWSRLALTTGGFALRVATAELIPTLIRFGSAETASGVIAKASAKMGYKLLTKEEQSILAHAMLTTSADGIVDYTDPADVARFLKEAVESSDGKTIRKGFVKIANMVIDEKKLERASMLAVATGGHMATGATQAGHLLEHDINVKVAQEVDIVDQLFRKELDPTPPSRRIVDPSGRYASYTAYDHHHDYFWHSMLQKAANDPVRRAISKDVLDALAAGKSQDEAWAEAAQREFARIKGHEYDPTAFDGLGRQLSKNEDTHWNDRTIGLHRYHLQDPKQFAISRTDDLRNTLTGHDGTFHDELAQKIVDNEKISLDEVMSVGINSKPMTVLGPELVEHTGNLFDRATNFIFRNGLDPIINKLSREPLFFQHFNKAMDFYEHQVVEGLIDNPTAVRLSMTRATHAMIPQIHNVALKSQFGILAKAFFPFYFAQEQALKRSINLFKESPQAVRYYQMIHQALNDPGFINSDTNGNRYLTLPGVGELGAGMIAAESYIPGFKTVRGMPINAEGNLVSLKTVMPDLQLPGSSPFVSIPFNALVGSFPGLADPVKKGIGPQAFQQSPYDALMPSAPLKNLFKAMTADETDSVVANSMMASIAAASLHGHFPPPNASPAQIQDFHDRIKNNALSLIFLKAMVGMVSPLAPKITQEDVGLRQEFQDLLKTKTYPEAWAEFAKNHGEGARSYTISKSEPTMAGTNIPYTKEAYDWLSGNEKLVTNNKYSYGAAFLVPQLQGEAADKQIMATELFKLGLRNKKAPSDFIEAIRVSHGNDMYYAAKDAAQKAIDHIYATTGNVDDLQAQSDHWDAWEQDFIAKNPVWYKHFAADAVGKGSMAKVAYLQLKTMFANGDAPAGHQTDVVKDLMSSYENMLAFKHSGYNAHDVNVAWKTFLDQKVKDVPESKSVINTVFARLP